MPRFTPRRILEAILPPHWRLVILAQWLALPVVLLMGVVKWFLGYLPDWIAGPLVVGYFLVAGWLHVRAFRIALRTAFGRRGRL